MLVILDVGGGRVDVRWGWMQRIGAIACGDGCSVNVHKCFLFFSFHRDRVVVSPQSKL